MSTNEIPRRGFLQMGAASAGALALGALSAPRALGANDRLQIGIIGVGGRGGGHLGELTARAEADNLRIAAVSDLYARRLTRAADACKGDGYADYRRMLDRKDIDAVVIATPDHWHSKIAIDAMESGKDVYVEKPMTHTIEQAIELRAAVKRTGRALQVGVQGTAADGVWKAREAIEAGRIGKVTWAQGSYNRNARTCLFNEHQKVDPAAGPDKAGEDHVDWDTFLGAEYGLAPKIDWTPEHFFRFRKYWAYSGGVATDLLYHKIAPLLIILAGPDGECPSRVTASGGLYIERDGRDIPDTFLMTAEYPSERTLLLVSTLTNDEGMPDRIYGKHGTMDFGGEPWLRKNGDFEPEFKEKNDGKSDLRIPIAADRRDHMGNFLDVIRGKEKRLNCNVELGTACVVAITMAVEAYRKGASVKWDAAAQKMVV